MRNAFFRLLAIALLAIAVPVQGLAAVTAGQCMSLGGQHQDGTDHESHAHEADGHDHAVAEDGQGSHCGPCAACCASAAISGAARLSIAPAPANVPYSLSQFPPPGVQPDGLDRPPLAL